MVAHGVDGLKVIHMRHDPHPSAIALLASLGWDYVVDDPAAPSCAKYRRVGTWDEWETVRCPRCAKLDREAGS